MCREWYMHPNGQLPAYEWAFGDVNPPVHAWAALRVFAIDGATRPRLPRAHLPEAAPELHLVGQPQGRRRRQRLRGRLPRPGQHRPHRPLGAAPRRGPARAVRRHGLDGAVLPQHARDRPGPGRAPLAGLRGHVHQVPRALRLHRDGHPRPRPVGRRRRLLLRRAADRRRADPAARPLRGRAAAAVRGHDPEPADAGARCPRSPPTSTGSSSTARSSPATSTIATCATAPRAGCWRIVGPERLAAHPRPAARRGRAALAPRHPLGLGPPPRRALRARPRRHGRDASTTRRPRARPACSAATRTGAGRCGSPSTRSSSTRCGPTAASSATTSLVEHPAGSGRARSARARSPTTSPTGSSRSSARAPTAAGRCTARTTSSTPTRPGTTRCPFHEYFHGDTGAGLGASHQTGWTGLVADLLLRREP